MISNTQSTDYILRESVIFPFDALLGKTICVLNKKITTRKITCFTMTQLYYNTRIVCSPDAIVNTYQLVKHIQSHNLKNVLFIGTFKCRHYQMIALSVSLLIWHRKYHFVRLFHHALLNQSVMGAYGAHNTPFNNPTLLLGHLMYL